MAPNRIDSHWQRAVQGFAAQDFAAARAGCEAVIARMPEHGEARWMLYHLDSRAGRYREAVEQARLAARSLGNEPLKAKLTVSGTLITLGESGEAVDLLRRIVAGTADPQALNDAATQFRFLELHDDALACAERATRMDGSNAAIQLTYAQALQHCGQLEPAHAAYERAIHLQPAFGPAHWSLAQLAPKDGGAMRVDRLRRLAAQARAGSHEFSHFHYALFRELDALDDAESAWPALAAGAANRLAQAPHDAAAESRLIDRIIAATRDRDFLAAPGTADDAVTPLFIVGMPRTGTTLLGRMLGNHPDVANLGELHDVRLQYKWATGYANPGYLDPHAADLMATVDAGLLGSRYLEKTAWRRGDRRFPCDKNQTNFLYGSLLAQALPGARILHLRRNAMDSCFSNFKEMFALGSYTYSYSLADVATHFRNYRRLMAHWRALTPDAILELDYEDLVTDPDAVAKRLIEFCGLPPSAALADTAANTAPVATASSVQVRQPIHQRSVGGWKRYERQLAPLRQWLGDLA